MEPLFDLTNSPHKNFLESQNQIWEAVKKLDNYINELFKNPPKGFTLKDNLLLGKNVEIDSTAKINGRAVIGSNTKIHDNVLIRDGVILSEDCEVGHAVEIKHSLILNRTHIAHLNYVGDSLLGNDVNIAGGAVLANFKNGAKNIEIGVIIENEKIKTGMRKLGALIGDGSKLGVNCTTDPGTIIGKNSLIYPLSLIRGEIPANKIVKNRPSLEIVDKE